MELYRLSARDELVVTIFLCLDCLDFFAIFMITSLPLLLAISIIYTLFPCAFASPFKALSTGNKLFF